MALRINLGNGLEGSATCPCRFPGEKAGWAPEQVSTAVEKRKYPWSCRISNSGRLACSLVSILT